MEEKGWSQQHTEIVSGISGSMSSSNMKLGLSPWMGAESPLLDVEVSEGSLGMPCEGSNSARLISVFLAISEIRLSARAL